MKQRLVKEVAWTDAWPLTSFDSNQVCKYTQRNSERCKIVFSKQQVVLIVNINNQGKRFGELARLNTLNAESWNSKFMMTFPAPNNQCTALLPPTSLSYFTAFFSVFLVLVTVPGNFLVCLAIIKDPFRNLKTPFNYFLLSLAVTDLAVGAILDPVAVAYHIDEALQLNVVDIKILHIFYFILSTASILTLAALTTDRYFAVVSPVKYKTMVTSKRAILASVSIWIGALGFSFIYFKLGFIVYSFVFANTAVFTTFGSHICSRRHP